MTPERWERVKPLLNEALEREPADRRRFVDGIGDEDLRQNVRELLAAADSDRLDRLRDPWWTTYSLVAGTHDACGELVGRFRLTRFIGAGGMGDVYEAEQIEPVRRTVALKLIRLGLRDARARARFDAERQTQATLTHDGIARLIDAGVADDGRPFFAMECVEGTAITRACDAEGLTIDERLRIFLDVCEAVEYAHRKGIIHRDLKPSNVLLAKDGTRRVVKIIDFGVAKAIAPIAASAEALTEAGQSLGTPGYMSPEQAAAHGGDVDTQSDVYSLGVILHELLIGVRPFQSCGSEAGRPEVQRQLDEEDPPRPAVRLMREGPAF